MNDVLKLADYGAIGVCLALIIYMYLRDKMFNKTMNNHLEHLNDCMRDETEAKDKLTAALTRLTDKIDNF